MNTSLLDRLKYEVLPADYALDDHVVDSRPEYAHVNSDGFKMVTECSERPFEAVVVLFQILILNEVVVFLVDTIIGELVEQIGFGVFHRVGFTGKPHEAFLVNVEPEGLVRCHTDVYSKVKLVTIDKQRVRYVSLDDGLILVDVHFGNVIDDVNSSTSRKIARLNDPQILSGIMVTVWIKPFHLVLLEHLDEISILVRENKGLRNEVPWFKTVPVLHLANVDAQSVFSRNFIALREMVDLLVLIEALVEIPFSRAAAPK